MRINLLWIDITLSWYQSPNDPVDFYISLLTVLIIADQSGSVHLWPASAPSVADPSGFVLLVFRLGCSSSCSSQNV